MDALAIGMLLGGLVLLTVGAELLVRGAVRLAAYFGVSPLVIGLTVVAYGTSTPELAVSLQAAWGGNADIAVANVVGSNIFNVLFILGISALIVALPVAQQLVRLDVPIMIAVSLLVWVLCLDGRLGAGDGAVLCAGIVLYTVWAIRKSRRETAAVQREYAREYGPAGSRGATLGTKTWAIALVLIGLGILVLGARWLVAGAIALAQALGLSDVVIGLTVVAVGTSLPELATSVVAAFRGERDIAVGNVVGSNIHNLLAILGLSSVIAPSGLSVAPSMVWFDLPIMLAVAVACLPIFFTGHLIARWEGALLFGYYVAYTTFLIFGAGEHDAVQHLQWIMGWFALPLTFVTLLVLAWRARRTASVGRPSAEA